MFLRAVCSQYQKLVLSQICVVRSCFISSASRRSAVLLSLGPSEVHLALFGVVRDAAAGAAADAGHRVSARGRGVTPRPFLALPTAAAPTQTDGHHQPTEDLQDPADETQHQAVSHTNIGGWGEDGGHDVSVPRYWDDGEDPWDEDEETSDPSDGRVRFVSPASHSSCCHADGNDIENERRQHQTSGDLDDLGAEVLRVLLVALNIPGRCGSPADVPQSLLEDQVDGFSRDVVDRAPGWCHGAGQLQDPTTRRENHPKNKNPWSLHDDEDGKGDHKKRLAGNGWICFRLFKK